jgi:hypothetical protein
MTKDGMSAAAVRESVFALRAMLDAAVADQRLAVNPAANIPLPVERAAEQRYLDREQVLTLADMIASKYRALVLLGAFGGLRWGEMAGPGRHTPLPGDGVRDRHRHRREDHVRGAEDAEIQAHDPAGPQHHARSRAAPGRVC